MRVLACGDIHCKTWIIDAVKKKVDRYDGIVFVGDYADDWNSDALDSMATWDKLYSLQQEYPNKIHLVCGNHDYIYAHKTPTLQSGYNRITQIAVDSPANKYIKDWLLSLPVKLELDGVTFSHAGLSRGWDGGTDVLDLWNDNSPLWVRPGWGEYLETPQVFGHTPQTTCTELYPNIWCIDTHSTYSDGNSIGDNTCLQIIDGKKFKKVRL